MSAHTVVVRRARAFAMLAGFLVSAAAATPAHAALSCSFVAPYVDVTVGNESVALRVDAGDIETSPDGVTFTQCGAATTANATTILIQDATTGSATIVEILDPASFSPIRFNLDMGGASDTLRLGGTSGVDDYTFGDAGATFSTASTTPDLTMSGVDSVVASMGAGEDVFSGAGDVITGNAAMTQLVLDGGAGADTVTGGQASDTIAGGADGDTLEGGNGSGDVLSYATSPAGVEIDLPTSSAAGGDADGDSIAGFESLTGSAFADTLAGDQAANTINGAAGDDLLSGRGGADDIIGDDDTDTVTFAESEDGVTLTLEGAGAEGEALGDTYQGVENIVGSPFPDTLTGDDGVNDIQGGDGQDTIDGMGAGDVLDGGNDPDTLSYATSGSAVDVTVPAGPVSGGAAEGDTISNFESLVGSAQDDTLTGDATGNTFEGLGGADTIVSGGGGDLLSYASSPAGVTVDLGSVATQSGGDAQGDLLTGPFGGFTGSDFGDTLTGTSESETIDMRAGDDTANAGAGADFVDGGDGDDSLDGGADSDQMQGGEGADDVDGGADSDLASFGGSVGVRVDLALGAGNDGEAEGDTYAGIESLLGTTEADYLIGNDLANGLTGRQGNDVIIGNGGDDGLGGRQGADYFDGGAGTDTVSFSTATGAVIVDLATGKGSGSDADGDVFALGTVENLRGSSSADSLKGDARANVIEGLGGADTLDGRTGVDTLSYNQSTSGVTVDLSGGLSPSGGHATNDTVAGFESLIGSSESDVLVGNSAANVIRGGTGGDFISGLGGVDTADYSTDTLGVGVNLGTLSGSGPALGESAGDTFGGTAGFSNVENVVGGTGNDSITGDNLNNVLRGGKGNDGLNGGTGNDTLLGEDGNDTLSGGSGNDGLTGGLGNDVENGGADNDAFSQGSVVDGADTLIGSSGKDTVTYASRSIRVVVTMDASFNDGQDANANNSAEEHDRVGVDVETVYGSKAGDRMVGSSGANIFRGGNGNDLLYGMSGNDLLYGDAGNDSISASTGADYLSGGSGNDTMSACDNTKDSVSGSTGTDRASIDKGIDVPSGVETLTYC